MIGRKKLSEIREELRLAFAAQGYNPLVDLDREIRELKDSDPATTNELDTLETFRSALAQVVHEAATAAKFTAASETSKAI